METDDGRADKGEHTAEADRTDSAPRSAGILNKQHDLQAFMWFTSHSLGDNLDISWYNFRGRSLSQNTIRLHFVQLKRLALYPKIIKIDA